MYFFPQVLTTSYEDHHATWRYGIVPILGLSKDNMDKIQEIRMQKQNNRMQPCANAIPCKCSSLSNGVSC